MATQTQEEVVTKPRLVADDARGIIEELVSGHFNSVLRITSKAGAVRANHYHKQDSHMCYLTYGKIRYVWRPAEDESAPLQEVIITPGQLFFSPPMIAHAMEFLEDSEFYAFTSRPRGQEEYEEDLVRVTLVEPKPLG